MRKIVVVLLWVVLACATAGAQPLTAVEADSVLIEDFFWNLQRDTISSLFPKMTQSRPEKALKSVDKKKKEWEERFARLLPTGVTESDDALGSAIEMTKLSYQLGLATGEARYFAAMEHCLYNGIAGRLQEPRSKHTEEAAQLMTDLPAMIFATEGTDVYVNLLVRNTAIIKNDSVYLLCVSSVSEPWYNEYQLFMRRLGGSNHFKLHIRVPQWMTDSVLQTADYEKKVSRYSVTVSGQLVKPKVEDGYFVVEKDWEDQDFVMFGLPTTISRVSLNDSDGVMLQKGSLLYTFLDLPEGVVINKGDAIHSEFDKDRHTNVLSGPYYNGEGEKAGEYHAEPYCFNRLTEGATLTAPAE